MGNVDRMVNANPPAELNAVVDRLRKQFQSPDLRLDGPPQRLGGGFWAEIWSIYFAPDSVTAIPSRLVLRLAPDPQLAAWENTIQSGVAKQGYPTPQIYSSDSAHDDHRAWCVMDFAVGQPLLSGLNGVRALATLPRLAITLSDTLAQAAADLHKLDIAPIEFEISKLDHGHIRADDLIDSYLDRIDELPDRSLQLGVESLAANRPVVRTKVICHGDLHPFNVLLNDLGYTVLDWTSAQIADPTFDLAYTYLLLANPPLAAPRALRPIINWFGRRLANRFISSYLKFSKNEINFDTFAWYQSLQAFRILFDLGYWRANDSADTRRGHPWFIMEPELRKLVEQSQ